MLLRPGSLLCCPGQDVWLWFELGSLCSALVMPARTAGSAAAPQAKDWRAKAQATGDKRFTLRLRAAALRHRALARGEAPGAARCCWAARAPLSAARPSTTQPNTSGRAYNRAIPAPHAYTSARSRSARNRACYSSRQLRTGGRRSAGGREA